MQRVAGLAARRELVGLAGFSPAGYAWRRGPTCSKPPAVRRQWAGLCVRPARPFTPEPRRPSRRRGVFAGQTPGRPYGSGPPGTPDGQPGISVVGIPDPITWIRCRVIIYLVKLYFDLDLSSVEFERGVKQALVHVSSLMSSGRLDRLVGTVSAEMREHVEKMCVSLTEAQRQQLSVTAEDIVFLLPEDISVVYDQCGRTFCSVVMRFWLLSAHEGPEDPEGTKIFKVASSEDGGPQKKIATAVYEFHSELARGAPPDWMVTTVWHWQWKAAE